MNLAQVSDKLLRYIKQNTTPGITNRGLSLYNQGKKGIIITEFDINIQKATFQAYGTKTYSVQINNFFKGFGPITSCTCPSDWTKICKHRVAAIFLLIDAIKNPDGAIEEQNQKESIYRNTRTPLLLPDFDEITSQKILELTEHKTLPSSFATEVEIFDQQLGAVGLRHFSDFWDHEGTEVNFFYQGDQLYTICACGQDVFGLCDHQTNVLRYILKNKSPFFLKAYNPQNYAAQRIELAKWAGISLDDFDDNFDFDFNQKKYIPKGKLAGLIDFAKASTPSSFTQEDIRQWQILAPILKAEEQNIYSMGYVIDTSYDYQKYATITPVIGKKSTTLFLKELKKYEANSNFPIEKTSLDDKRVSLATMANMRLSDTQVFTPDETSKAQFNDYQSLIPLLSNNNNIYIRHHRYENKVKRKDIRLIEVSDTPAKLFFELSEDENFFTFKAKLQIGSKSIPIPSSRLSRTLISPFLVKNAGVIYLQDNFNQVRALQDSIAQQPIFRAKQQDAELFFDKVVLPASKLFPIKVSRLKTYEKRTLFLESKKKEIYVSDMDNYVLFEPAIRYTDDTVIKLAKQGAPFTKEGNVLSSFFRDEEAEKSLNDFMAQLHPDFSSQKKQGLYYLNYNQLLEKDWFFDFFSATKSEAVELFGIKKLKRLKYSPQRAQISTQIASGQDWFDINIKVTFGDEEVKIADLKKAIIKQSKYIQLNDGKLGVIPEEWLDKLAGYFRVGEVDGEQLKISKRKFSIIDQLFEDIDNQEIIQELAERRRKIKDFKNIKNVSLSSNMTATLRPYQKEGINWLHFLDEFKWGGILADDMGLGKTVQVLSLLQSMVDKGRGPHLVVVPTSLLFNWQNEIQKFAPNLDFHVHYGPDRSKNLDKIQAHDITLTSYGVVLRDIPFLQNQLFSYVILDESQAIKNVLSQRYKASCLLQAENRIAMTGTPIENNTFDLYAQMNFLNPGFLGSQASFKRDYSKPIDSLQDSARAQELQKLISPFVLRRTKEQVAKELPPKIEDYIYVNLGEEQQKVYDAFRNKYRDYLLGKIKEDGLAKSKMYVLEGLTKLRLICDSPTLVDDGKYAGESAKIQELIKHITEKTANHKMLVFSQFTKMLALVKTALDKEGIPYEYLDGQCTQNQRKSSVDNFQENKDIRVFLISLKAGNVGLNLTAADYVYLLDPWWNPAVESQAIDRTHRIGQDKHVIAYRMIAKNTIEEKIMKLQQRKKKLASDLIQTDESVMKSITQDDILDLFG